MRNKQKNRRHRENDKVVLRREIHIPNGRYR